MTKYHEVNIPIQHADLGNAAKLKSIQEFMCNAIHDNYKVFVLNVYSPGPVNEKIQFDPSILEKLDIPNAYEKFKTKQLPSLGGEFVPNLDEIEVYSRLTLEVKSEKVIHTLSNTNIGGKNEKYASILHSYDTLAARTDNLKVFEQLCKQTDIDMISFDFSKRLDFFLSTPTNKKLIKQAIGKEIMFELCYSHAFQDSDAKKNWLQYAISIIEVTKGQNIVFGCDSSENIYHRSPFDMVNVGLLVGLSKEQALAAVGENCERFLQRGRMRKSYRGVADIAGMEEVKDNQDFMAKLDVKTAGKSLLFMDEADMEQIGEEVEEVKELGDGEEQVNMDQD